MSRHALAFANLLALCFIALTGLALWHDRGLWTVVALTLAAVFCLNGRRAVELVTALAGVVRARFGTPAAPPPAETDKDGV